MLARAAGRITADIFTGSTPDKDRPALEPSEGRGSGRPAASARRWRGVGAGGDPDGGRRLARPSRLVERLEQAREIARERGRRLRGARRARDETATVRADQIRGSGQSLEIRGRGRGRQLDLDGPARATKLEDEVDLEAVARAEEVRLVVPPTARQMGQDLLDDPPLPAGPEPRLREEVLPRS